MARLPRRRIGVILAVILLLSVVLVPSASAGGCSVVYWVRPGDTLQRLAWRYHVTMYQIAAANGIINLNRIYIGQRLVIPQACPRPKPPPQPCPQWGCPGPPPGPAPMPWMATYWNNRDLSGTPVLQRPEGGSLNYNWGWGSPASQVNADNFSARWQRTWFVGGGSYRMFVRSDDGVRVFVDGQWFYEDWSIHPVRTFSRDVWIPRGYHTFVVEYFEAEGEALVGLDFIRL